MAPPASHRPVPRGAIALLSVPALLMGVNAAAGSAVVDGNLVVGGEAVFSVSTYIREVESQTPGLVDTVLGPAGVDVVTANPGGSDLGATFDAAAARGVKVFYDLDDNNLTNDPLYTSGRNESPVLAGVIHSDDTDQLVKPSATLSGTEARRQSAVIAAERNRQVKANDPDVATVLTLTNPGARDATIVEQFAPLADVVFGQVYTIYNGNNSNRGGRNPGGVFERASTLVDGVNAAGNVPGIILLGSGDLDTGFDTLTPTPGEIETSAWLAASAGAKAISFYEFASNNQPRLDQDSPGTEIDESLTWDAITRATADLQAVSDDLLFSDRVFSERVDGQPADTPGGIFFTSWIREDGSTLQVIVNAGDSDYDSTLSLAALLGEGETLVRSNPLEGRTLNLSLSGQGEIRGVLPAQSVEIFEVVSVAVPEPGTLVGLASLSLVTLGRRRGRRSAR